MINNNKLDQTVYRSSKDPTLKLKSESIEKASVVQRVPKMSPAKKQKVTEYFLEKDYNKEIKQELSMEEERKKRLELIGSPGPGIVSPLRFKNNTKSFTSLFSNKTPQLKNLSRCESP